MDSLLARLKSNFLRPQRNYAFIFVRAILAFPQPSFDQNAFLSFIDRFNFNLTQTENRLLFMYLQENGVVTKETFLTVLLV